MSPGAASNDMEVHDDISLTKPLKQELTHGNGCMWIKFPRKEKVQGFFKCLVVNKPQSTSGAQFATRRHWWKRSACVLLPFELWIIIITIASTSLKDFAEYTRVSRVQRRIFWSAAIKARIAIFSKFGCLGIADAAWAEETASRILETAADPESLNTNSSGRTSQITYSCLVGFLRQVDAFDVVKELIRVRALKTLDEIIHYFDKHQLQNTNLAVAFTNNSRYTRPVESYFERLWIRAAYNSENMSVLRVLVEAGFESDFLIYDAVVHDIPEVCMILAENGYNLHTPIPGKNVKPLHLGARMGSIKVIKLLLNMDVKIDALDAGGMSPLHVAIEASQKDMVNYLAKVGGPDLINKRTNIETGVTALSLAVSQRKIKFVKMLLNLGADIKVRDSDGSTLLHVAARSNSLDMFKLLHSKWTSPLDIVRGDTGITPLLDAVLTKSTKAFMYLLDAGCDHDMKTVITYACKVGFTKCIKDLLERGEKLEPNEDILKKSEFACALPFCAQFDLVAAESDWTSLNTAIVSRQDKLARFLVDKSRCSVNLCTNWGLSPFYAAAGEVGDISLAKFLLCRGANWDIRLNDSEGTPGGPGFSALHRAVQRLDIEGVKFLIELWGPEWRLKSCVDWNGSNPLHIVAGLGVNGNEVKQIINILAAVRPDWLHATDVENRTPCKVAYQIGEEDAVAGTIEIRGLDAFFTISDLMNR
ncbi:hypothetical protein HDU76_001852 [Blyttiomyces sp. JEL0837]|nr:hypothetical protein HDU76_001852 [Blyttiomyces sp. JEL0837]